MVIRLRFLSGLPGVHPGALLDDSRQPARWLRAAEVEVRLDEFHTFQMSAGRTTVAGDAIREAGSWLRSTLVR
ncbi:hypothetical protein BS329_08605 [Amycolatopsis coloradensis]|uniref:Uncharacterized protein n=1 Tax=Amycolatopsis coloradensis TaxID=76021 RepID=A0A1R0KYZ3_9PSEU|nr:hypothetical protein BS329_08605 [Amycolatopsis coloradensis]